MLEELVYGGKDVEELIKAKFPSANTEDASDDIHENRFSLSIEDTNEDDFYVYAIQKGFADLCFKFALMLRIPNPKDAEKIKGWIAKANVY